MESNKGLVAAVIILSFIVLGLGGYIVYNYHQDKEEDAKQAILIDNVSLDLNAFHKISNILNRFDKAFNNPKSLYVGYLFVPKKLDAAKFSKGAAIYASMIDEMAGTNGGIEHVPEGTVKKNFEMIFGKNLKYEMSEVDSGEVYKVAFLNSEVYPRYNYIAPSEVNVYDPKYISVDMKISLEEDKIIVNRKSFFVEYTMDGTGKPISASIYKNHAKINRIGEVDLRDGEINEKEVISKFGSKLYDYDYIFNKVAEDDYTFYSVKSKK